ncbi:PE domain-containing protein [Mycobacterium terramassiliense]|uniref:PE-PGRS family protein, triacylglycerol lipase (Esterase/lipase) (Triglyceride lipase) (Tributyrase) n=1 Tax=Mycobacterium terramassiliense TaxID=1841859 RepID=A0A2U3NKD9_9MYCO|nr:PE domain-containing protein [Mycobacterium terramassiliense]SPM32009.1 PE-PGRS family protein, triacylglycerol lipase (esterase/lipase) (triglyceride lipase) (tributyrase) [Mycobacterium terramassiliense]
MSYVIAAPEFVAAAATDLAGIGSSLGAAHAAAASRTTAVLAAAGDEVSGAIAALFSGHGQQFQALAARAAASYEQFVQALTTSAGSYASAEAANVVAVRAVGNGIAAGFNKVGNTVVTDIFGAPANPPFPATQPGTFTGMPSLATRIENAAFWPVKDFLTFSGIYNQWGIPASPFNQLLASGLLSPILGNSPPKFLPLLLGETVQHTTYDGMPVVQITPAHPNGDYVVAIHGGAFILPPTILHWLDYTVMAYQTGATIEVPIYPLMQQGGTAGTVVPAMAGLISSEIAAHGASHVSVIGDSAGGTLALAAVESMVANNETVPASMVLLSPWLDVSDTNPNIGFVHDPLLPPLGTGAQQIGKIWAGGLPENNPLVSPLYGSLKGLPPTYVYSGSLDSVAPDALVLQQEAAVAGAPISFVLATGGIHDWVLLTVDGFRYWPQIDQELGI